jgi:1-acyl-sn-glycerol-3-phosphate acyltransferase
VQWWRLLYRLPVGVVITAICAAVPALVRFLSLGSVRAWGIASIHACRVWGRGMTALLGVRVRCRGPLPVAPVFVVTANHLSYLDILVLGGTYPTLFVAKRSIRTWPLFGWIARGAGTLFVDRERAADVLRAGRAMTERLESGLPLTLFPEGRSTPGKEVLPFMPSLLEPAARLRVPCHAVSLRYETPGFEPPPSATVCWYDGADFVSHYLRLMAIPRIEAEVRFAAEPIVLADRKQLAHRLRDEVARGFVSVRQDAG